MSPLAQFHALRLPESFPDSLEALDTLIARYETLRPAPAYAPPLLSTLGQLGLSGPSAREVLSDRRLVLALAVLSLRWLRHANEGVILDPYGPPHKRLPCTEVFRLISEMARGLVVYDDGMDPARSPTVEYARKTAESLKWLETMGRWYRVDVRQKRIPRPRVQPRPLKQASGTYTILAEELEEKVYHRWADRRRPLLQQVLTEQLWHALQRSAPETRPYSMRVVSFLVANVLTAFEIVIDKQADELAALLYKERREFNSKKL
jgi:hypothetical protein